MSNRHLPPPARHRALLAIAASALIVACATDDAAARRDSIVAASEAAYIASHRASAPPDTADTTARGPVPLTDGNILARIAQDDRLEVQVAGLATAKITSPALKDFALAIRLFTSGWVAFASSTFISRSMVVWPSTRWRT